MSVLEPLLRRHAIWAQHLEKVCHQIGEKDLVYKPMPESNSAAWILNHLIELYREFITLTSQSGAGQEPHTLPSPGRQELAGMPFPTIFTILQDYRAIFTEAVKKLEEEGRLEEHVPAGEEKSWLDLIYTLINQEVYHCGQLAYIAKILQQKENSGTY